MAKSSDEKPSARQRVIKLFVHPDEALKLRVAAAITDESPGEFARTAALEKAAELLRSANLSIGPPSKQPKR